MTTSMYQYSVYLPSIFLFFITVMQVATFVTSTKAFPETDQVALQAFKSMIAHDPQGILNSWNESHHFCEWEGITCSRRHQRVTVIDLSSKSLAGSLSPYIGNLSFLREIDLSNNTIQGEIPHEFGRLFRLEALYLFNNSLVGKIPTNLSNCSKLTFLSLGRNKLVGNIPIEFVYLHNLKTLSIHTNNITGGIPNFIGNLTSLKLISLTYNAFQGNIPDSLGQLKDLNFLALGDNNLSGTIPPSIYNLSSLEIFSLPHNQLHGCLPLSLGFTLPNLRNFQIHHNNLSGSIPISLSNASKLELIEIGNNNFSGKFLVDFGGMENLSVLIIGINNLGSGEGGDGMEFMNSLVNCSNLITMAIDDNQFRAPIPRSIANLSSQLQHIAMGLNQLYGSIPSGMDNLVSLELLVMQNNQITGTIPKEIGKFKKLRWLHIAENKLYGEIPSSLGNLSALDKLLVRGNKLSGVIPSSLGKLKQLTAFDLSQNEFSGIIPEEIFNLTSLSIGFYLGQNHLVGSIPQTIGNLIGVSEIQMSDNNLSGEIPSKISACASLEILSMGGNLIHGSIPQSMSSLRGIQYIDFSRNNLSGKIPKFLETLPLKYLNLSFNNLEGEVPTKGIFTNSSQISVAGNNNRLCGGIVELRLPSCTNNEKKQKISRVFKILISTASAFTGLVFVSCFIFYWLKKRRGKQPSGPMLRKSLLKVSYDSLLKATDGFSSTHLIGVGSFGSVYKGILDQDGTVVAIKVLNLQRRGASKSFLAECKALKNVRHRNLVRVITSCSSTDFQGNDFKALVYEYKPNGSLEKWLHPDAVPQIDEETKIQNLTLLQRISIAIDVASALDYLHHHCHEPILHCDLKPSNVLLDNDLIAHVGDFGLARFCQEVSNPTESSSIGVRGTIGYAAPEYGLGTEVSINGDVYSYGILLLEMVTRKKPTDMMFEGNLNLHNFARMAFPDRVMDIVDPILLYDDEDLVTTSNQRPQQARLNSRIECIFSIVRIGVDCSMESPQDRMNISNVVHELQSIRKILLEPGIEFRMKRGQQS